MQYVAPHGLLDLDREVCAHAAIILPNLIMRLPIAKEKASAQSQAWKRHSERMSEIRADLKVEENVKHADPASIKTAMLEKEKSRFDKEMARVEASFAQKLEQQEESLKKEAKEIAHVDRRIRKKFQVFASYVCATLLVICICCCCRTMSTE